MKKVWLVNQHAMPPDLEPRLRTIKFAHYMTEAGYDVTIFASSIMHNMNKDLIEDNSKYIERKYGDLNFVHIKTQLYNTNGIKRVIGLIQFPFRFMRIAKKFEIPDIIIQTATVPFGNIIYYFAKKIKAKYIIEVVDLWPQSFVDLGIISKRNPLLPLLYYAEKWLYKSSDMVVFSVEGGKDYIIDRKWNKGQGGKIDLNKLHYINNGVDLSDFNNYLLNYKLNDEDLLDENVKNIIYLGSMRLANNLKQLIDVAVILKSRKDVRFLLYGDGDDRTALEKYCKENNISNVYFKEKWINPQYVPFVLSKAYVNVLNYMSGDFGKYGGSQSKLFQYLAAGKPICSNIDMGYDIIKGYKVGISREYSTPEEYAEALISLVDLNKDEYDKMCERAKSAAKDFDYKSLTNQQIDLMNR